ncbi:hypothetical protein ACOME3_007423 [Neoechinorhynchus agilis]
MSSKESEIDDEIQDSIDCIMIQSSVDYSPVIRAATYERLIDIALTRKRPSLEVESILLLSYRNFLSVEQMVILVKKQFDQLVSECHSRLRNLSIGDDELTVQRFNYCHYLKKQHRIEQRLVGLIKLWLTRFFLNMEKRSPTFLKDLQCWLNQVGACNQKFATIELIENIRSLKKIISGRRENYQYVDREYAPSYVWSLSPPELEFIGCDDINNNDDLLLIHPIELARQITLYEFDWFRDLAADELLHKNWQRRNKSEVAPVITNLTRIWNSTSFWVRKVIMAAETDQKRIQFIVHFVDMASACLDLCNFSSFFSLTSGGLGFSAVRNLDHLWKKVPEHTKDRLSMFDAFYDDGHYRPYLNMLKSVEPPCIPFLPDYLTKVLKIEDGNPDFIEQPSPKPRLINILKQRRLLILLDNIGTFQSTPYNLKKHNKIQEYFARLDPLNGMTVNQFEDYLYELKNMIEKRDESADKQ